MSRRVWRSHYSRRRCRSPPLWCRCSRTRIPPAARRVVQRGGSRLAAPLAVPWDAVPPAAPAAAPSAARSAAPSRISSRKCGCCHSPRPTRGGTRPLVQLAVAAWQEEARRCRSAPRILGRNRLLRRSSPLRPAISTCRRFLRARRHLRGIFRMSLGSSSVRTSCLRERAQTAIFCRRIA